MSKRRRKMTRKEIIELYKRLYPPVEDPPVLNARIIEHSTEEIEEMENKEKERIFWNKMIRENGIDCKKDYDN